MSYNKNASTLLSPASLIKIVTAILMRQWIKDADLDLTVTVTSADMYPPTTAQLQANDVISWRDLTYGLLVPSGNDASLTIGRLVGEKILASEGAAPGTGLARFITAMQGVLNSRGMTGAVASSTHGVDTTSLLSPVYVQSLFKEMVTDPFLKSVAGTLSRTMTITGVNARTYSVIHTINPNGAIKFPEFVAGKTGTYAGVAEYCVCMLWATPSGSTRTSVVMKSPSTDSRFSDLRKIMDYELTQ